MQHPRHATAKKCNIKDKACKAKKCKQLRTTTAMNGNAKLRNLLFMCSFNACKYNKACKAIYDRIVAKGKSKKLALIAVCNKLLKQAFAIAKSGLIYDDSYRSVLVNN